MAKCKVELVRKGMRQAKGPAKAGDPVPGFSLQDNQDNTVTVFGQDAAGAQVDVSGVATLSVSSSDPSVLSIGTITGMTFPISAAKPGHVDLTITATWNDGSLGPFTLVLPGDVSGSAPTGLSVTFGAPTSR